MKKIVTWIIVLAVVGVGVFFGYRQYQQAQAAAVNSYQYVTLEMGDLIASVAATGTVRPNQTAILTWQTSGTVQRIEYREGELVKAGETLARLDKTTLSQSIILAEADLVNARRNLENLTNSTTAQAQAELVLVQAQKKYDDLVKKVNGLVYPRGSQAAIDNAEAQYILAKKQYAQVALFYKNVQNLDPENRKRVEAELALTNAQLAMDQALANWNYLKGVPDEQTINDLRAQLTLAESQLADAQREWERLKDGPDPNDIAAAQARVDAILATLRLSYIESPFAGTITQVSNMVGDQVTPGTIAFRLDDLSKLLVDVQISEVDINRVRMGQDATVTFDAILNKEYKGKVVEVARIGQTVQGVVNFTVTVELINPDENVLPGMTAAVNLVVNQLNDVLLVPNRAVRMLNGQRVVYIMQNNFPTAVEITLGATSDLFSEITASTLKAGDTIILNPPSADLFGNTNGRPSGMFGGMSR